METNTSLLYRILKKCRILKHEKYKNITLPGFIFLIPSKIFKIIVYQYAYHSILFEPLNVRWLRAKCWSWIGCSTGKNIYIARHVELDYGNASMITIEDNVIIANGCTFLCHKRDNSFHHAGNISHTLPYIYGRIHLKKNCQIGINVTILPGVTIGEGAVIGAASLVVKDIPDWSIAIGNPARVVKQIQPICGMPVTNE